MSLETLAAQLLATQLLMSAYLRREWGLTHILIQNTESSLQHLIVQLQEKLEQSQRLVDQEQQLHLSDQKRIEKLEQPVEEDKATQDNATDNQKEEQPKKSFFKRLFGNK